MSCIINFFKRNFNCISGILICSIFILATVESAIGFPRWLESRKYPDMAISQAYHVLEEYPSYDKIVTGRFLKSDVDVAEFSGGKDVCITIHPGSRDGKDVEVYFHVNPDLSFNRIPEEASAFAWH
jgi:hypothetical protein